MPALLTRTRIENLQETKRVSKSFECKIRSEIRSKLPIFGSLEHPLLQRHIFDLTTNTKGLTINDEFAHIKLPNQGGNEHGGRCLAWQDASLGRWRSLVRIRPTPLSHYSRHGFERTRFSFTCIQFCSQLYTVLLISVYGLRGLACCVFWVKNTTTIAVIPNCLKLTACTKALIMRLDLFTAFIAVLH
jgi:hypothetical protein